MKKFLFENGVTVTDIVTGFEGVVTGRADYLTGCNTYLLTPKVAKSGTPLEARWFDETRLKVNTKAAIITLPETVKTGGPHHASELPPTR